MIAINPLLRTRQVHLSSLSSRYSSAFLTVLEIASYIGWTIGIFAIIVAGLVAIVVVTIRRQLNEPPVAIEIESSDVGLPFDFSF